ncbi:hypothetical protein [Hymenobacter aerophilus]|uniref:hypothetical protein n=1 Tax=Hymenobacter aerophilus TaxID=119644 RepID=UPI0012FBDCB1|nr:hypothetical protein [Hymenobacter aerophilus]
MTRASLLRILDHVDGISDNEIRELEQLAAAFPYCQTAHVLLAKTAHDRGSMLAGQRLRRAATYAADRELLRQLLERPVAPIPTATPAAPAAEMLPVEAPQAPLPAVAEAAPDAPVVLATASAEPAAAPETDLFAVEVVSATAPVDAMTRATEEPAADEAPTAPAAPANTQQPEATDTSAAEELITPEPADEVSVNQPSQPAEAVLVELPEEAAPTDGAPAALAEASAGEEESTEAAGPDELPAAVPAPTETVGLTTDSDEAVDEAAIAEAAPAPVTATTEVAPVAVEAPVSPESVELADELLPAVAPPIRPPSSAGISRFEFGLGESRLPEPTGYRLPGFDEDDEELGAEDGEQPSFQPKPPPPITAPFRADAELGYALGGGSRLGYDLQARTPDGFVLDLPLEAFFEPDALLLAHARAHQPAPKASSLDLINRFLKAQPRIKAAGSNAALPATEQADLSVRSSAGAPALASESLAKIMVRQGKTAKAIEIYERLMTKQPEKMAYFAEQIQQLQQPPE